MIKEAIGAVFVAAVTFGPSAARAQGVTGCDSAGQAGDRSLPIARFVQPARKYPGSDRAKSQP